MASKKHKTIHWPDKLPFIPKPGPEITLADFGLAPPTFTQMTFLKELIKYCNCYKHSLYWLPIYKLNKN